jgi:hypothetical protein
MTAKGSDANPDRTEQLRKAIENVRVNTKHLHTQIMTFEDWRDQALEQIVVLARKSPTPDNSDDESFLPSDFSITSMSNQASIGPDSASAFPSPEPPAGIPANKSPNPNAVFAIRRSLPDLGGVVPSCLPSVSPRFPPGSNLLSAMRGLEICQKKNNTTTDCFSTSSCRCEFIVGAEGPRNGPRKLDKHTSYPNISFSRFHFRADCACA